jgi:hypothetical protein
MAVDEVFLFSNSTLKKETIQHHNFQIVIQLGTRMTRSVFG